MPLKDKEKRKDASKARMQKMREGVTKQGVTDEGVTGQGVRRNGVEMVPASYVEGINGRKYEVLPERERYLKLPDGQVLDRLNQSEGRTLNTQEMQAFNESSYNYHPKARKG